MRCLYEVQVCGGRSVLRLTVTGIASTHMLLRVIGILAQRGHALQAMTARIAGETMAICIDVEPVSGVAVDVMVEKIRSLVEVHDVSSIEF